MFHYFTMIAGTGLASESLAWTERMLHYPIVLSMNAPRICVSGYRMTLPAFNARQVGTETHKTALACTVGLYFVYTIKLFSLALL